MNLSVIKTSFFNMDIRKVVSDVTRDGTVRLENSFLKIHVCGRLRV